MQEHEVVCDDDADVAGDDDVDDVDEDDAGMNVEDANTFLNTDEGEAAVWKSYGDLIKRYRIKEIPVFTFTTGLSPFDPNFKSGIGIQPYVVVGSSSVDLYVSILERLYQGIPPSLETIAAANNSNSKI